MNRREWLGQRCDEAFILRTQQIVLGSVVRIKRGAADGGFLHDLADPNVSIGATVEQVDKGGIDPLPGASNPLVFGAGNSALRDVCRFLFCNCHGDVKSFCS